MKIIIISVTNDLVSDQRIDKVANSLISNDFSVILVGRLLKNSYKVERNYKTKRFRLMFTKGPLFYAEFNFRLFLYLIFSKADIFLSNDLDTLIANYLASKIKRTKLVYDSHEYFTEVPELINRPKVQKIWLKIEKWILPKVKHSYTVCHSIADVYNRKYAINMQVVRNVPLKQNAEIIIEKSEKRKIILYQGAVNIGRGIEYVIKAMKHIDNSVFWIIGNGDILENLKKMVEELKLSEKVVFFGKIPFQNLKKYTVQADLGISLEENIGLNYYYALPNKIFDYINANVPILASQLPEIKNIINKYNIGTFIEKHDEIEISNKIKEMFSNDKNIKIWKNNMDKAKKELCWENEEIQLLKIFQNI